MQAITETVGDGGAITASDAALVQAILVNTACRRCQAGGGSVSGEL